MMEWNKRFSPYYSTYWNILSYIAVSSWLISADMQKSIAKTISGLFCHLMANIIHFSQSSGSKLVGQALPKGRQISLRGPQTVHERGKKKKQVWYTNSNRRLFFLDLCKYRIVWPLLFSSRYRNETMWEVWKTNVSLVELIITLGREMQLHTDFYIRDSRPIHTGGHKQKWWKPLI